MEIIYLARTTPFVSQGLQTRDIDACVLQDLKANTANKVNSFCSSTYNKVYLKMNTSEKRATSIKYISNLLCLIGRRLAEGIVLPFDAKLKYR